MTSSEPSRTETSPRVRPAGRRRALTGLLVIVTGIVAMYSVLFHAFMAREGQSHSWLTGIYWTLQTMMTLGYGDITFTSDLGRAFSMAVLATGVVLLFVLLPFTLIQFVYAPWLEARNAARTPRALPAGTAGHVILTGYGPVEGALIQRLDQFHLPYVVILPDAVRALALHDQGVRVMMGRLDDPETYRRAHVGDAALVATTLSDATNANVVLTVRESSAVVPIVATAAWEASVDLLKGAGCQEVIQLGEMLGRAIARRIAAREGRLQVIGQLDGLLIAEASVTGTSLVGQTVRDSRLRERLNLNVVGVWERGRYSPGTADTHISEEMTLLLSGTQADLDVYNREIRTADLPPASAIVIGGGRVGRATSRNLIAAGIDHRVVEKLSDRVQDWSRYVIGDATDPEVLTAAGLDRATNVAITTHDDDVNVYLTLYCRRRRPDVQILSRATLEQNVSTLHRAGADFVLSYVPMEATAIFDIVRRGNLLLLAEGLEVFTVRVPPSLVGKPIADSRLRDDTGCNVLAVRRPGGTALPPDIAAPLEPGTELVLIGDREDERKFFERYS
jgi:voltage-gated potassium channel